MTQKIKLKRKPKKIKKNRKKLFLVLKEFRDDYKKILKENKIY